MARHGPTPVAAEPPYGGQVGPLSRHACRLAAARLAVLRVTRRWGGSGGGLFQGTPSGGTGHCR